VEVASNCLVLALAASRADAAGLKLAGSGALSGLGLVTWSGLGLDGKPDAWLSTDGAAVGSSAGHDRDGADYYTTLVSKGAGSEKADVEVLEAWYPIFFERRGPLRRPSGAGRHRAGRSLSCAYRTTGSMPLRSAIMGNRERVPISGFAGGRPGGLTRFWIHGQDGVVRRAPAHSQGMALEPGEIFEFEVPTGGGWGDPVERDPSIVEREVRLGQISVEDACSIFGVVPGDAAATKAKRDAILEARLNDAERGRRTIRGLDQDVSIPKAPGHPLYPGVEQRGAFAVSVRTGAVLALAPDHWTDGCPTLRERLSDEEGIEIVTYLDPVSGHALAVDVVAQGLDRAFATLPLRWTAAGSDRQRSSPALEALDAAE
jgi:N-methylhydantoinase B